MSWLSFWCTVAHLVINAVIIVYCLTLIKEWHWKDVSIIPKLFCVLKEINDG